MERCPSKKRHPPYDPDGGPDPDDDPDPDPMWRHLMRDLISHGRQVEERERSVFISPAMKAQAAKPLLDHDTAWRLGEGQGEDEGEDYMIRATSWTYDGHWESEESESDSGSDSVPEEAEIRPMRRGTSAF